MVHTAVVLPTDLIAQLKADAKKSGRGMSAEIRDRLRATYLMELSRGDPETGNLLHDIRHLSNFLARDYGKRWHQHAYVMAAFKAGLANFLARYQPEGDERVPPDAQDIGDPPDVVGRTLARRIGIAGHEGEDEDYDPTDYYDETDPDVLNKRKSASNRKKMKG
jgi:plasmid stability protein